jgi:uncharacterized glyoxalase superfamily protein PhnB
MTQTKSQALKLKATSLTPNFTATDLAKSIRFYEGLGFEVRERHERDGRLAYVTMSAGSAEIGIGQDDFKKGRDRKKGVGQRIWIVTEEDLDALAAQAKGAGISLDPEPRALDWGGRAFSVTDPDGFAISIVSD